MTALQHDQNPTPSAQLLGRRRVVGERRTRLPPNDRALDEFVDEDAPLEIGCRRPGSLDIQVFKNPGHLLETLLDIVGLLEFQSSRLRLAVDHRHGPGDASFLLGEQIGPNPVVVVEAQQLSSAQMRQ